MDMKHHTIEELDIAVALEALAHTDRQLGNHKNCGLSKLVEQVMP